MQTGLPAAQRHRNVRNAFAVTGRGRSLADAVVVLVDDVSTTGATLEACARALKQAGVREVRALTAARVVAARRDRPGDRLPGLSSHSI
jgi:predicted amidophosphoribosyltransferase